ncbi:hypothetical protein Dd1591_3124 [Dickeya chrysanthemi Ech1591]|uniref:Uncharacterized protein n=1 Tax=Dickeya chrysanthemi (strain Ech1591) TaxID=561229 RepID=C6CEP1_DICC1|nr:MULTISPECIES: hypothetical protein [Dickeya]ACT07946.1 hypothetical protein Dd1591_3124 [Dickeya chrysanthemi Ech1591]TYL44261.1 hypothetical protein FDP13_02470 [Dickeya sp. ws52]WJM86402.1 hypothetical protein QUF31_04600 [Dickeya chrysanthemi]
MVISGIQNQNITSSYPQQGYIANGGSGESADAVGVNKSASFSSGKMNNSPNNEFADNNSNDVTDTRDRTTSLDERLAKEKLQKQQTESSVERSLRMTGIPLYGGVLVSVVKYPDGQSESYNVFTGKRLTSADLSVSGGRAPASTAEFGYYSQGLYSGMSAAEVYEKIQQMLGASSGEVPWTLPGSNKLPQPG